MENKKEKLSLKELVEFLNNQEIIQERDWLEDIPEDIYKEYFDLPNNRAYLDTVAVNEHRWYEDAIEVYKFDDEFLGVNTITKLYSESSGYEDCYHTLKFYVMEQIPSVTYKVK